MDYKEFMDKVHRERIEQDYKWGVQNHSPEKWVSILGEEYGSVCKAINQRDIKRVEAELIQVVAVCKLMIDCIDLDKALQTNIWKGE